jgi:glycine/D-amino acid oxidase-like deaminating enzyme
LTGVAPSAGLAYGSPSSAGSRVLILGAGIAGCALAFHLGRRGLAPVVVDPGRGPRAATPRSAGILAAPAWDPWDVRVTQESITECAELSALAPSTVGFERAGYLRIARSPESVAALGRAVARWEGWGIPVERPGPAELHELIPAGEFEDVAAACLTPSDAVVDPGALAALYAGRAQQMGARFRAGRLRGLPVREGDGWHLSLSDGRVAADRLVVCAGAWSERILRALGTQLPLVAYRAQIAQLRVPPFQAGRFPTVHDLDFEAYVRSEGPSRILAGDGSETDPSDPDSFELSADPDFLSQLHEFLEARFPGWEEAMVEASWAGQCVATPDRRPVVGPVPEVPGLFVLTGLNDFGIMRAGALARRLASVLVGRDDPLEQLGPVLPDRWRGRFRPFVPWPGCTLEDGETPPI